MSSSSEELPLEPEVESREDPKKWFIGPLQLKDCDMFWKMSPHLRAVKVNELKLCHICMKHLADKESWKKNQPDY
jgi:hypothetical protein